MRSFKELDDGYWSIITNNNWFYISPTGGILNTAEGKWNRDNTRFTFDRGPTLDLNHVFIVV